VSATLTWHERDLLARILIVDDDPIFAELTARRLTSGGHSVVVRTDATGILTEVREVSYDLLLIDVVMPGISGTLLMDALSSRDRGGLKLVFLSSKDSEELANLATQHRADGWVSKSASRGELLAKLGFILVQTARVPGNTTGGTD
jgi:DNA-binding response OmpR family regulator